MTEGQVMKRGINSEVILDKCGKSKKRREAEQLCRTPIRLILRSSEALLEGLR